MQLIIKTTTTLVHLLNLLAVIQVACDIQQSGLLVESWTRDEVEKIQNWPKLGPDLGQESLLALASGSGSGYFGRYQRAAAAVASRSHKQQSQAKELEKETGKFTFRVSFLALSPEGVVRIVVCLFARVFVLRHTQFVRAPFFQSRASFKRTLTIQ